MVQLLIKTTLENSTGLFMIKKDKFSRKIINYFEITNIISGLFQVYFWYITMYNQIIRMDTRA